MLRSLAAAAIVTAAAACGHYVAAPPPPPFYQPDVSLRGMRLRGVGLFGGALDLWMNVYNPNPYDLAAPRVRYVITVNREQVATGYTDLDVVLPARDSMEVRVPAEFNYSDLGPAGRAIIGRGDAWFRVEGRISVGTPYGRFSFPYDRVGQYGMMDAARRDEVARERSRGRDHQDVEDDRGDGREHAPGLTPGRGPDPRERQVGSSDGRPDQRDPRDAGGPCRGARPRDRGDRQDGPPCGDHANGQGPGDGHAQPAPPDTPPNHDAPRDPEHHQQVAHEPPGQQVPRLAPPREEHAPGPVHQNPPPGHVEHAPVAAPPRPGHPGDGAHAPPPADSSARPAPHGGKPCPPPEPHPRGRWFVAPKGQQAPPPCAGPDSGGRGPKKPAETPHSR